MQHSGEYADVLPTVRDVISQVVKRNLTEGILFSGGLDTSVLAFELAKLRSVKAYTLAFKEGTAKDLDSAKKMASLLNLDHTISYFGFEEMVGFARKIIKILKVFDPMEVRNSLPVILGLEIAKDEGIKSIMTGDGLDELFLGYPWLFDLPPQKLEERMTEMWETMSFSSKTLGSAVGIEVNSPFLDPIFKKFASEIDLGLKLNLRDGKKHGKWVLRKAYENFIPEDILWRDKTPLEEGTGTAVLPTLFERKIDDDYFKEKRKTYLNKDSVELLNKEQFFYYEIFRGIHGKPSEVYSKHGKECPNCKANVPRETSFCKVCGAYPINGDASPKTA